MSFTLRPSERAHFLFQIPMRGNESLQPSAPRRFLKFQIPMRGNERVIIVDEVSKEVSVSNPHEG